MKTIVLLSCVIVAIKNCNSELYSDGGDKEEGDLISVVALLRHGDRAPYVSFPNDRYFNISYWPMGHGHLTNKGKERAYQLGKWLRNRYNSSLPLYYSPRDIYIRSTDADRCLESAAVALAGLYPIHHPKTWSLKQLWQPIPIHTKPFPDDEILGMRRECREYTDLYKKTMQLDHFKNISTTYADLFSYISEHSGWSVVDLDQIKTLHTIFDIYKSYNQSFLPEWYKYLDKKSLLHLAAVKHESYTHTTTMKRLVTGPFWGSLTQYFDDIIKNTDLPKFIMLMAHDTTTVALLNSMGAYDFIPPVFGATIIWELRKDSSGGYYMNVLYKRDGPKTQTLKMQGCDMNCDYKTFKEVLQPVTIDMVTWEKECMDTELQDVMDTDDRIRRIIWLSKSSKTTSKPFFIT